MNFLNVIFHRQTEPAAEIVPADEFISEDFFIAEYEAVAVIDFLAQLRERTYNFVYENRLTWGVTEFMYGDLPVSVTLNEDYNILYTVNRHTTTSPRDAAEIIADAMQF